MYLETLMFLLKVFIVDDVIIIVIFKSAIFIINSVHSYTYFITYFKRGSLLKKREN